MQQWRQLIAPIYNGSWNLNRCYVNISQVHSKAIYFVCHSSYECSIDRWQHAYRAKLLNLEQWTFWVQTIFSTFHQIFVFFGYDQWCNQAGGGGGGTLGGRVPLPPKFQNYYATCPIRSQVCPAPFPKKIAGYATGYDRSILQILRLENLVLGVWGCSLLSCLILNKPCFWAGF